MKLCKDCKFYRKHFIAGMLGFEASCDIIRAGPFVIDMVEGGVKERKLSAFKHLCYYARSIPFLCGREALWFESRRPSSFDKFVSRIVALFRRNHDN
jgi:hypothetical protein